MMKEILTRRFHNDWPMPDLVLLDGGAGHLNMAEKLLREQLGLDVLLRQWQRDRNARIKNYE